MNDNPYSARLFSHAPGQVDNENNRNQNGITIGKTAVLSALVQIDYRKRPSQMSSDVKY